ncbi:hypothetical protein ACFQOZ_10090 [Comamonas endophytica]
MAELEVPKSMPRVLGKEEIIDRRAAKARKTQAPQARRKNKNAH